MRLCVVCAGMTSLTTVCVRVGDCGSSCDDTTENCRPP